MTGPTRKKASVRDLDLRGKRVFVRVDFNVPLEAGRVSDDTRIRASLPTIRLVLEKGGRPILASHLGRPKGKPQPEFSLAPVTEALRPLLGTPVTFSPECVGEAAGRHASALAEGETLLLENLRFHPGEEKNDEGFARQLAALAGAYVNDAFGSAHRAHASVAALCGLLRPAAAGLLMEKEIDFLGRLLGSTPRPYVALLGGAKVSDKIALVRNLMPKVDTFLIGGAMAYTFLASRGIATGDSRVETESVAVASAILEEAKKAGAPIRLPIDHRVADSLESPGAAQTTEGEAIPSGKVGLDIGPRTVEVFRGELASARTVLWNGPVGLFERPPFDAGSRELAAAIVASGALSVAGGGDTAAALARFGLAERFSHVSTGGGASLEFLSGLELPGVAALTDRS
ncbi:MAG TPA: phosphoglycerate kinase [Candidatus Polarisedimenticolia bacterium]|jgi:phosphoglycerate kinase|nr:phosphoglycerate kinase [Candidatus Polarisedimenticolia bacterium]